MTASPESVADIPSEYDECLACNQPSVDELALAVERVDRQLERGQIFAGYAPEVRLILADHARLRAAKWDVKHVDTMNDAVSRGMIIDDQAKEIERLLQAYKADGEALRGLLRIAESDADFQGAHPARDAAIYTARSRLQARKEHS